MIWDASESDLPEILRMAELFANESGIDVPFDSISSEFTARQLMDDGLLLVGEGGMIGGLAYPHFFNAQVIIAQEIFWWVDIEHRGSRLGLRLFEGFESWARDLGAKHVTMIALASQKPVHNLYLRKGYREMESSYVRELWQ